MPAAAAFFVSALIVVFSRSLAWGPALVLLLLSAVIAFEPLDSRTAQHLIDVQGALWLGAGAGLLFLLASSLDRLVDLNVIYPTVSWPLIAALVAAVIVAVFGTLTAQSYRDGVASVLDFSLLIAGLLFAAVAFLMLWWTAHTRGRPALSTVKYGVILLLLSVNVLAWPTETSALSALLFGAATLVVYVCSGLSLLYFRVPDDPLPLQSGRLVLLASAFVLQTAAYVASLAPADWVAAPLVAIALVWGLLFGLAQRCVGANRAAVRKPHAEDEAMPTPRQAEAQRTDLTRRRPPPPAGASRQNVNPPPFRF